jgi:glycosyltransferase involved in cell wall biosynthesis
MHPLVSVVVPAYNCADYIGDALRSIFAQTYGPLEVIVVDDGSTDDTAKTIETFPQIAYVRQENGGPSRARNAGIRRASAPYIAFLDADDLWTPSKLSEQVAIMLSHPEAGLVFGDMRNFSSPDHQEPTMFEKYRLTREYFGGVPLVAGALAKLLAMNFIPTGTVLTRREVLLDVGPFDEGLRQAEDWDLWMRIALRYPIAYTSSTVMLRRLHAANSSKNTEQMSVAALAVLEKLQRHEREALHRAAADVDRHLRDGYRNLGYFYLRETALVKARRALWHSLSFGVQGRALLYLACTFLGTGVVRSVLRARG